MNNELAKPKIEMKQGKPWISNPRYIEWLLLVIISYNYRQSGFS